VLDSVMIALLFVKNTSIGTTINYSNLGTYFFDKAKIKLNDKRIN
jgi:hypothetical protein